MSELNNPRPEHISELSEENAGYDGLIMLGYTPAEAEKVIKNRATEDDMSIQIIRRLASKKSGRDMLRQQWEEWIRKEVKPPFLDALTSEQIELIRSGK